MDHAVAWMSYPVDTAHLLATSPVSATDTRKMKGSTYGRLLSLQVRYVHILARVRAHAQFKLPDLDQLSHRCILLLHVPVYAPKAEARQNVSCVRNTDLGLFAVFCSIRTR